MELVDFSVACNSVNHYKLQYKLGSEFGLSTLACNLLETFLDNWSQVVKEGGTLSAEHRLYQQPTKRTSMRISPVRQRPLDLCNWPRWITGSSDWQNQHRPYGNQTLGSYQKFGSESQEDTSHLFHPWRSSHYPGRHSILQRGNRTDWWWLETWTITCFGAIRWTTSLNNSMVHCERSGDLRHSSR